MGNRIGATQHVGSPATSDLGVLGSATIRDIFHQVHTIYILFWTRRLIRSYGNIARGEATP